MKNDTERNDEMKKVRRVMPVDYDEDYCYEEQVDVFTFADLFAFLKRSMVRAVIFCVIAAFVMGMISAIYLIARRPNNESVDTMIAYSYPGIEQGNDPLGYKLNTDLIKSAAVVSKAIDAVNVNGEKIANNSVTSIISNIEIEGVVPEKIRTQYQTISNLAQKDPDLLDALMNFSYFPTDYIVRLHNYKQLGLDKATARELMDKITTEYIKLFREKYAFAELLPSDSIVSSAEDALVVINSNRYDYLELYDVYYHQIVQAQNFLRSKATVAPTFRSATTGRTFSDIVMNLTTINNIALNRYEAFVVQNSLTNDAGFTIKYLESRKEQYEILQTQADDNAKSLKIAIDDYKLGNIIMSVDPTTGNLVLAEGGPTPAYDNLVNQYVAATTEYNRITAELSRIEQRMKQFSDGNFANNTTENKQNAAQQAAAISEQLFTAISDANTLMDEYMDTELFKDAVLVSLKAQHVVSRDENIMALLIASIAVVVLAGCAALIVTYKKEKAELENAEAKSL